ncbi:lactoferrin/transferrin family TonB-dependent receptor [Moraxella nasovis]|uniref:lactoferrin/transferrin family TonB-dependent receptor n=1 Tax=Moraxella nasovis TaxID=2904121 RepID=UPI001F606ABD|nr:lactoferrin/transferrin family TonB-dependent receptor [Moraxella nasovis]UNU72769.1 lactoferrin/transferrin family TonB-dependent receptor [Moraxella nasovis]
MFQKKFLTCQILAILCTTTAFADDTHNGKKTPSVQLQTTKVTVNAKPTRFKKDVSGLSRISKSQDDLKKEQVTGIRDMVKYDAGVSVVEQGRGGSSGYAIYGVDKNRVAVTVDGVAQSQSYVDETSNSGNTGSMNEVEIANVYAVDIAKGSNGAFAGSGALGGSVEFTTKKASHIIPADKDHVFKSQSTYTSRDKRFTQTLAAAMQSDTASGLIQYTKRKGEGVHAHKDAGKGTHTFERLSSYEEKYDLRDKDTPYNRFRFDDCTGADCVMYFLKPTSEKIILGGRSYDDLSEIEKAQYANMQHKTETVSAKDYAGYERLLPNPMDYESDSYLGNFTFTPNENHNFGLILEDTRQRYDSRDMSYCNYLPTDAKGRCDTGMAFLTTYNRSSSDLPKNASSFELTGIHKKGDTILPSLKYTRVKLLDELHKKQRASLSYDYTNAPFFDKISANYTYQKINQNTASTKKGCSLYPSVDENCDVSTDKAGSFAINEKAYYGEKTHLGNLNLNKNWSLGNTDHRTQILLGASQNTANYHRTNTARHARHLADIIGSDNGIDIYKDLGVKIFSEDTCYDKVNCTRLPISMKNTFIGLSNISRWDKLSLSASARFDKSAVKSDDKAVRNKTYRNQSWGIGLNYDLTDNIALLGKISTGFRVPSFQEIYGYDGIAGNERGGEYFFVQDLNSEKSKSRELGIRFNNGVIDVETSIFSSQYRDLIAKGTLCLPNMNCNLPKAQQTGYHNAQNADLKGVNVRGRVDLNALYEPIPEGLVAFGSYSKIKADRLFLNKGDWHTVESYPLEAVQPGRFVYGLSYDNPNEKWGATATWIYSKSKNLDELAFNRTSFGSGYDKTTTALTTKPWMTLDLSGYYHVNDAVSLRAGINNVLNYRYTTWESARQSSSKGTDLVGHQNLSPSRYAAPGRNFTLGMELTF